MHQVNHDHRQNLKYKFYSLKKKTKLNKSNIISKEKTIKYHHLSYGDCICYHRFVIC